MVPVKYIIFIFIPLLFCGCKSKQVITEKISTRSDSSAVVLLENEVAQKEIQITSLQSDLNRFKEESLLLRNEVSIHEINYDTSQPINPQTLKPPISAEITTNSNIQLENTINQYEVLLRVISIENTKLTKVNSNLNLTVETLTNEYLRLKTEKTSVPKFFYLIFFTGILLYIVMCLIYFKRIIN